LIDPKQFKKRKKKETPAAEEEAYIASDDS
jgi:hypothetical protein